MNLRNTNLRYAALKLIADIVDRAMKDEKAAHLAELEESSKDSGAKSWTVTIGDTKVAGITLSQQAGGYKIADEEALAEWLEDEHPDMVETTVKIKPWAAKQLLASIVEVTEEGAVTSDGEILPGVIETPPGAPYQSLRWDTKNNGKELVAEAIREGYLKEVLAGTGLPLIGGTE